MRECWHILLIDFYVVTKFILPSIKDLKFSKLIYDNTCAYLQEKNGCTSETKKCI